MKTAITFGYTGKKIEELKAIVDQLDAVIIDCRFSPRSRNATWNQSNLIKTFGDKYAWFQEFGNVNYKGGPIALKDPIVGLKRAKGFQSNIILLCMCKDYRKCHTKDVITILESDFNAYPRFSDLPNLTEKPPVEDLQTTF